MGHSEDDEGWRPQKASAIYLKQKRVNLRFIPRIFQGENEAPSENHRLSIAAFVQVGSPQSVPDPSIN